MKKAIEIKAAKKRRKKLLQEFTKLKAKGWTQGRYAKFMSMTTQRMGQLLAKARVENAL